MHETEPQEGPQFSRSPRRSFTADEDAVLIHLAVLDAVTSVLGSGGPGVGGL